MRQNKLITLFKLLDPDEFRMFYKFIRSIYYQNNEHLVRLYEYLRKYYPDFPEKHLKKEKIFDKVFPGRLFDVYKLASLMSKMVKLVEEYLLTLELKDDPYERKKRLTNIYGKRNHYRLFKKGIDELLSELNDTSFPNYQERVELLHNLYFHPQHNRYDKTDYSLEHLLDNLDHYFALTKLRYGIALKNKQRILSTPYEWRFVDAIEEETVSLEPFDLFHLYQYASSLLDEKEHADFDAFEHLLFKHLLSLSERDQTLLYFTGLNYANRQGNTGNLAFSKKAFQWYRKGLLHGVLMKNDQISETTFGNIVVYGCREKEFEWTQNFITAYQSYLDEKIRDHVTTQNLAWIQFSKGEFKQVMSILMSHSFSDQFQPKVRLTMVRSLFELFLKDHEYYELLMFQIDSFDRFIARNTFFTKGVLRPYANCIRIIKGLAKRISDMEPPTTIKAWLQSQTKSKSKIIVSAWLYQKVEEL